MFWIGMSINEKQIMKVFRKILEHSIYRYYMLLDVSCLISTSHTTLSALGTVC